MGLPETLLSLFAKLVEFRRSNPKKALILGFVLLLFLRKVYDRLTRDGTPIENKIVLITGGGMGIGRLVAEKCKKENGTVIVWDINDEALAELRSRKIVDSAMKVDVTNREQVLEAGRIVLNKYKHVDILINNAGIVSGKTITQLTERDVRKTFDVNIIAHFWTLQAFLPIMTKRQSGHIVTIASTAGRTGVSYLTDYCASKFACRGLDDALRHELQDLGHTNIKQTVINPYFINTGMFAGAKAARHWLVRLFVYFLTPERVSNEIISAIKEGKREVILPYRLSLLYMMEPMLPYWFGDFLIVNSSSMEGFTGRSQLNVANGTSIHKLGVSSKTLGMDLPQ